MPLRQSERRGKPKSHPAPLHVALLVVVVTRARVIGLLVAICFMIKEHSSLYARFCAPSEEKLERREDKHEEMMRRKRAKQNPL